MHSELDGPLRNSQHLGRFSVAKLFALDEHERVRQRFGKGSERLLQGDRPESVLFYRDLLSVVQSHRCFSAPSHAVPLKDRDSIKPRRYAGATFESLSSRVCRQKHLCHQILRIVFVAAQSQAESVEAVPELIVELVKRARFALPKALYSACLVCCQIGGSLGEIV